MYNAGALQRFGRTEIQFFFLLLFITLGSTRESRAQGATDFVPGTRLLFADAFEKDALADFPARWNTNGSGSLVNLNQVPGKWLDLAHNSVANPMLNQALPENCSIQFDLFLQAKGDQRIPLIQFGLTPVRDILKEDLYYQEKFYVSIGRYTEENGKTVEYGLRDPIGTKNDFDLTAYVNKVLHVAMAINKTRIRVYLDGRKLIDLPRALTAAMRHTFYIANSYTVPASELGLLISNIRIAATETDARALLSKQLLEEGRAETNEILFEVNSAVLLPASFPVLDQLGETLKAYPDLRILITGHTDSDGSADKNLQLSKARAAAVKTYFETKFKIEANRLETTGAGASKPVADNKTAAGKAKNRRVEFVKR